MMAVYVSVHARTSTPITMETPMTEYVSHAVQIAINAQVLTDAHNAVITNITKLSSIMESTRLS